MDSSFLSKIFEERSGYVYKYIGTMATDGDITAEIKSVLDTENFISRVVRIKGDVLVYVDREFPPEQIKFVFVADLIPPEYHEPPPPPEEEIQSEGSSGEQTEPTPEG